MFEFITIAAIVLAIAILTVIGLASAKTNTFSVRRTSTVQATAEEIFPLVNNFHQWPKWSPWEHKDPAMKRDYSGAESGNGAVYAWDGNNKVGSGRMEIIDASWPSKIRIKLDFLKPFEGHNTAEFTFVTDREAATTNVVWSMHGPSSFISKVMQVFMDFDKMIGRDFEAGLEKLKTLVETTTAKRSSGEEKV
jgi:uncharacterized protein YndB with AHSA1/START domain